MSAAELLEGLRRRGVTVIADGGELVFRGETSVLTPRVMATVKKLKPALLELLRPDPEVGALVERVGQMMAYFQKHADEWDDQEYRRRRDLLLPLMDTMDAGLARTGHVREQYGWTLSSRCQWHRNGEPPPKPIAAPVEDAQRCGDCALWFPAADLATVHDGPDGQPLPPGFIARLCPDCLDRSRNGGGAAVTNDVTAAEVMEQIGMFEDETQATPAWAQ